MLFGFAWVLCACIGWVPNYYYCYYYHYYFVADLNVVVVVVVVVEEEEEEEAVLTHNKAQSAISGGAPNKENTEVLY